MVLLNVSPDLEGRYYRGMKVLSQAKSGSDLIAMAEKLWHQRFYDRHIENPWENGEDVEGTSQILLSRILEEEYHFGTNTAIEVFPNIVSYAKEFYKYYNSFAYLKNLESV